MTPALRPLLLAALAALTLGLVACGGDSGGDDTSGEDTTAVTDTTTGEDTTSSDPVEQAEPISTTPSVSSSCSDVETFEVEPSGQHEDREFTAADYATNPPTAGDHNPSPIDTGQFYSSAPPLGEVVHALEHGSVIGWTNGLDPADQKVVEDSFNKMYGKGYFQLAVVEWPDLEGGFAMSSWDSLQRCETPSETAIADFIENHYAPSTTAEAQLACTGQASRLPACKAL